MTDVMAHSAFGVVQASFLGGAVAALVMFGVCFLWGRTPLLPWSYRILVPLMAAAFVVLGAFPAGTFPRDASVVALYVFYIVLALLGCAVLLCRGAQSRVAWQTWRRASPAAWLRLRRFWDRFSPKCSR